MKIDTKEILAAFPHLTKNPFLAVSLAALIVPVVLLWAATKFVSASIEAIVFFGVLGVCALGYSAWVISFFKKGRTYENSNDNK